MRPPLPRSILASVNLAATGAQEHSQFYLRAATVAATADMTLVALPVLHYAARVRPTKIATERVHVDDQ